MLVCACASELSPWELYSRLYQCNYCTDLGDYRQSVIERVIVLISEKKYLPSSFSSKSVNLIEEHNGGCDSSGLPKQLVLAYANIYRETHINI